MFIFIIIKKYIKALFNVKKSFFIFDFLIPVKVKGVNLSIIYLLIFHIIYVCNVEQCNEMKFDCIKLNYKLFISKLKEVN